MKWHYGLDTDEYFVHFKVYDTYTTGKDNRTYICTNDEPWWQDDTHLFLNVQWREWKFYNGHLTPDW